MGKIVYMLCGIPGSGKSTYIKDLNYRNAPVISSDAIRGELFGDEGIQDNPQLVFKIFDERIKEALLSEHDCFFIDATFARRRNRRDTLKLIREISPHSQIVCVYLDVPVAVAIRRNNNRTRVVPEEVIRSMHQRLLEFPPSIEEGFDTIYHIIKGEIQ